LQGILFSFTQLQQVNLIFEKKQKYYFLGILM